MADYGHDVSFGVSIDPAAIGVEHALRTARLADSLGLDLLAVQDHPYQPGHLDSWTLLTYLAAATERIAVMPDVADLQLRPPTMLAKAASSLALITGGRVQLGVGGGAFPEAIAAMGAPRRTPGAMVTYSEAAVEVLTHALRGGPVEVSSPEHSVSYVAGPAVRQRPQVWLGAQQPRMLGLVGRRADGWVAPLNIYVPPDEVPERQRIIDDAARAAGRDPARVRRIYNVLGTIGAGSATPGSPGLVGDAATWVDFLATAVTELGFDTFVIWPHGDTGAQLELLAREVVPAVRRRVAHIRRSR